MNLERTIFVQIPSYRDPQLLPTLKDMIENAKSPFLLRVVICWQHGSEQDIQSFEANGFELTHTATEEGTTVHFLRIHGANIELIDIDYVHSKGCGWARNLAQRRYRGEHYNLQIDSHHRFSGEWDLKMKSLLERPRVHSPRPVLTGCPPQLRSWDLRWKALEFLDWAHSAHCVSTSDTPGSTFDFEQFTSNHLLCKNQSACQRPLKRMNGSGVSSTSAQCESTFPAQPAALHFRPRCLFLPTRRMA